jgi:hypothetical protein
MKKFRYLFFIPCIFLFSCSKPEGKGGKSRIIGKIWVKNYNTLNDIHDNYELKGEYPGEDEDVYIIYGDDIGYGDKVKAGPDGIFVFDYLREGNYRVYVQSKDTNRFSPSGIKTVDYPVRLTDDDEKDVGTLQIFN